MYHVWVGRSAGETRQGAVMPGEWCMAWMVRCTCWEVVRPSWTVAEIINRWPTGRR